jgi:hypothetical protein
MAIQTLYPNQKPSLLLDFANVKALDPRITFTRTTTATYYNGVTTAKAEENLLLQSQAFNEAVWTKQSVGLPITPNTEVAPNGTTTAESIILSVGAGIHAVIQTASAFSGGRVASLFVKAGTHPYVQIAFNGDSTPWANFDVTSGSGAVGSTGSNQTASIVDAGNGWYRCIVYTTSTTATNFYVTFVDSSTSVRLQNWTALGTETIFVWGAQLEQRSAVTAYTPTTTQPITNYIPVLLTAASGVARFDHNPTTGESLGLLVEEQRSNLLTYSDDFANAAWTKTRASITSNTIVAPSGELTGDKLVEDTTASNTHSADQFVTVVTNTDYTFSCYVKAAERSQIQLFAFHAASGTNNTEGVIFNLSTLTVGTDTSAAQRNTITAVGNGWYRISGVFKNQIDTGTSYQIRMIDNSGNSSYTGDGYSGIFIWGAQLEQASFSTSYIPTVAATVTRNADVASMTGTNFSSWYRADEGTLYAEYALAGLLSGGSQIANISDNSISNFYSIFAILAVNAKASTNVFVSGSNVGRIDNGGTFVANLFSKAAVAITTGSRALSCNGNSPTTASNPSVMPVLNKLSIGSSPGSNDGFANGTIKKLAFYPTRATNAQLVALTS